MYSQDFEDTKGSVDFDFFDDNEADKPYSKVKIRDSDGEPFHHGHGENSKQTHEVRVPSTASADKDHDDISDVEDNDPKNQQSKAKQEKDQGKSFKSNSPGSNRRRDRDRSHSSGKPPRDEKTGSKTGGGGREVWGDSPAKSDSSPPGRHRRSRRDDSPRSDRSDDEATKKQTKGRRRSRSRSSGEDSYSASDFESDVSSDYDSGSDITDVSPLQSPHKIKTPKTDERGDRESVGQSEATVEDEIREHLIDAKRKGMDLKMLMQAVMELEREDEAHYSKYGNLKASKRITFDRSTKPGSVEKRNFSFKDDRVRDIDKENTRLMQEIVRNHNRKKQVAAHTSSLKRVTHSSVNRMRDQRRIEMENLQLLKRLERAKPTGTLCRNKLINEFENKSIAGVKVYGYRKPKSRLPNASRNFSDTASVHSDYTMGSEGRRSRPTSASTTQSSVQYKMSHAKPEWSDRW